MSAPAARRAVHTGLSALMLLLIGVLASVGLWVGIPLAWLWIAGRVEGATHSVGAAVVVGLVGVIVSIVVVVPVLGWIERKRFDYRQARGLPEASGIALEAVIVVSAVIAAILFTIWFLFLAGADPFPISLPS